MKTLIFFIISFLCVNIICQEATGKSNKGKLIISDSNENKGEKLDFVNGSNSKVKYKTPFIEAELKFDEPSGNNALDAGEIAKVLISLKNVGAKSAYDCAINLNKFTENREVEITGNTIIKEIKPDENREIVFAIKGSNALKDGQMKLTLTIIEKNGFDLDPVKILFIPTREYQPPILKIVDYGIIDENKDLKITKREEVALTIRIQNIGENTAFGVMGSLKYGVNILSDSLSGSFDLGDIKSGEFKDIKSNFYTNNRATVIEFSAGVIDRTQKYFDNKTFTIPLEVPQIRPEEIIIAKNENNGKIETAKIEKLDLAINIPVAKEKDPNSIAIIIGNKNYQLAPIVDFALNDAALVKNYVKSAFGFSDENIFYLEDAKLKDLFNFFGKENNYKGKLYDYVKTNLSKVFIYYSGHGAPSIDNKQGYLVPVDCDPNKVELDGYALKTFYENLDKIAVEKQLKQVTVVMDACFSGSSDGGSLLKNVSPIYITLDKQATKYENSTIISSTSTDQVSSWYKDKQQSLFTYFFLKGLKGDADFDKDGKISAREIYDYTADEVNGVPYWARRINGRTQTPTIYGKDFIMVEK